MKTLIIFSLIFLFSAAYTQNLEEENKTSSYSYIFKLSSEEADILYKKGIVKMDSSFLHTLIDSFKTKENYTGKLENGHYIKAGTDKNMLVYSLSTIQNFELRILDNNSDLLIQVFELNGNIIEDAEVKIKGIKLKFDKKTKTYKHNKSNKKGLLIVKHKGLVCYYELDRQYNNPGIKRISRKVIWGTPIRFIWRPIRYTISLPIDGVKSLIKMRTVGSVSRTYRFFRNPFHLFNRYFNRFSFNNRYQAFTVFNKPIYKPGDTVKFKAFIVNSGGKPINKNIDVKLYENYGNELWGKEISPYKAGGYSDELILNDSLNMKLDKNYTLYFKHKNRQFSNYTSGSFKFEDYELHKISLSLKTNTEKQYRNNDLTVSLKGIDENELNLQDARYKLFATCRSKFEFFDDNVYIPDTLFTENGKMKPSGETKIIIPDSVFPKANFNYELTAKLLTSDNEIKTESKTINYIYKKQEIKYTFQKDSVNIWYEENGICNSSETKLYFTDNFNNRIDIEEIDLPATIKLNPFYSNLCIKTSKLSKTIQIKNESSGLQCYTQRNKDSLYVYVENPRNLNFTYFLYKQNKEVLRNNGKSLTISIKHPGKKPYLFSIQYMWGGEIKSENYAINYNNNELNITVNQPKLVFPGQKLKINIEVKDKNGKPVKNTDITAYAVTDKFDYSPPNLPKFKNRRKYKNKEHINSFHFEKIKNFNRQKLNYQQWKKIAGLDSMEYYQFIYPEQGIYKAVYTTEDNITQFSPYVMHKGSFEKIHVIYTDDKPVYFSWMTNIQPYSFKVDSGYHRIKMRLSDTLIVIDSIYFQYKQKTIFSLNKNYKDVNINAWEEEAKFDNSEINSLKSYIFPYRYSFWGTYNNRSYKSNFAYVLHDKNCTFLNPKSFSGYYLAGPVKKGYVDFNIIDGYKLHYYHEPNFEYDFLPNILKMREKRAEDLFPKYLYNQYPVENTADLIMTTKEVEKRYEDFINEKRYTKPRYTNPLYTSDDNGTFKFDYHKNDKNETVSYLNIFVIKPNDENFFRIYPGNTKIFYNLKEGIYKLLFLYPDSTFHSTDSVLIKGKGLNYKRIYKPDKLQKDSFSIFSNSFIREKIITNKTYYSEDYEKDKIFKLYKFEHTYKGNGFTVEGYVRDDNGEALPGVSIIVKGTNFGTMSLANGYYSINVPIESDILIFSYIGMETDIHKIKFNDHNNVFLEPSSENIEEVVVTALGISKAKKSLGYSVVNIDRGIDFGNSVVNTLQGKIAGVNITGSSASVLFRGMSSLEPSKQPLIVIDGVPISMSDYNKSIGSGFDFGNGVNDIAPELLKNVSYIEGSEAVSLYGSRAAGGVILINTTDGNGIKYMFPKGLKFLDNGNQFDSSFFSNVNEVSKLRTNFSDYGFWEPMLRTDKNGKVEFEITIPDDITKWETHVLAINNKRQTGKTKGFIKSYKPLAARLSLPRFLLQGDSAFAIGKSINYLSDSSFVSNSFHLNDVPIFDRDTICRTSLIDKLLLNTVNDDTLKVKYMLKSKNGYFDGEERKIPVFPVGLENAVGSFNVLDKDTSLDLSFDSDKGDITMFVKTDALEIIDDEIGNLLDYVHKCNEQMASKLKAMMADKQISEFKNRRYKHDNEVRKLIRKLSRHQNDEGLWGWWAKSESQLWISTHVLEALLKAENNAYKIKIDKEKIKDKLEHQLEKEQYLSLNIISSLKILKSLDAEINYEYYINKIVESLDKPDFFTNLRITELKQYCGLDYDINWLKGYQQKTFFGNTYYSNTFEKNKENFSNNNLHHNDNQATIISYNILRNDSSTKEEDLLKMRNYFFEQRKTGYWRNTYESSKILETILPDLMKERSRFVKPEIIFSGTFNDTINEFPYQMKLKANAEFSVKKTGTVPVYFTTFQRIWDSSPERRDNDFIIRSRFSTKDSTANLMAGEQIRLIIELEVLKDADYVMLDIPIPAGCSYASKKSYFINEVHREYRKHKTNIYCQKLNRGSYKFEIELLARFTGSYTLNPSKAELMYFPTFFANTEVKNVKIQ